MSFDSHSVATSLGDDTTSVERVEALVGNTSMVQLTTLADDRRPVFVKMESANPGGSIRDRYIAEIVDKALLAGQIVHGDTVVLAGIDDSAVSAGFVASTLGLKVHVFAPESNSKRLLPYLKNFDVAVTWTSHEGGLKNAIREAAAYARSAADRMYVDGYRRMAVKDAYHAVGDEIIQALGERKLGGFVTSVTTGATFREVSRVLRASHPQLEVRGARIVENEFASAEENPFISQISLDAIWALRDEVFAKEGIRLGPKGAACVKIALELRDEIPEGRVVVALNPDDGERYVGWEDKPLFTTT